MSELGKDNLRRQRLSPRARLLLVTGAVLTMLPCLGLGGSTAFLFARRTGLLLHWRSLGAPPSTGIDIVTGDTAVVYVLGADGAYYGCQHGGTRADRDCWFEAAEPYAIDHRTILDQRFYDEDVQPPSGIVMDTLEVTVRYAEDIFESRYALLSDGTIWLWEYDVGAYHTITVLVLGLVGGTALGILIAIVLWGRAGLRRKRGRRTV